MGLWLVHSLPSLLWFLEVLGMAASPLFKIPQFQAMLIRFLLPRVPFLSPSGLAPSSCRSQSPPPGSLHDILPPTHRVISFSHRAA